MAPPGKPQELSVSFKDLSSYIWDSPVGVHIPQNKYSSVLTSMLMSPKSTEGHWPLLLRNAKWYHTPLNPYNTRII